VLEFFAEDSSKQEFPCQGPPPNCISLLGPGSRAVQPTRECFPIVPLHDYRLQHDNQEIFQIVNQNQQALITRNDADLSNIE
jgi:hypothetical protein